MILNLRLESSANFVRKFHTLYQPKQQLKVDNISQLFRLLKFVLSLPRCIIPGLPKVCSSLLLQSRMPKGNRILITWSAIQFQLDNHIDDMDKNAHNLISQ